MDDDILSQFEELLSMASSEEELQVVLDLYDEYTGKDEEIGSLLEEAETEEDIQAVIDLYEEEVSNETEEATESIDYGSAYVEIRERETEVFYDADEFEEEPLSEEETWEKEWLDREGEPHPVMRGEPLEPGAELRQTFAFVEDAIEYIGEIGAGAGYFDIYEEGGNFSVWFTG